MEAQEQEGGRREQIAKQLCQRLGPEYIKFRSNGSARMVAYIEGWTAIEIANRIFGYDGWTSEIKNIGVDYIDISDHKVSVGVHSTVRISLSDGTYREDIGFGSVENVKGKGQAIEHARKASVTDALKRTLRQFGNALGNCCYDENYTKIIKSMPVKGREQVCEKTLYRPGDVKSDGQ